MNKHVAAGLMVGGIVAAGAFAGPKLLEAQQQQQFHVIVVHDVLHVISPPLRNIVPIPPAYGLQRTIPLRHPFPVQAQVGPPPRDPALQTSIGPLVSTTPGKNFLGVGVGQPGYSDCCAPPDTNGAAGATQFVQWVNLDFAVFSKTTGSVVYGPAAGNTLWSGLGGACASSNSGDPIAQYDKQAGRWVMMQPVFSNPYQLCVAVSTTSDVMGTFNLYQIPIPGNYFPDYPKLGVWTDGYYVSYNAFNGNSFISGYACALDRSSMLTGAGATMQCFEAGGYPSLVPADLDGDSGATGTTQAPPSGAPDYFIDFSTTSSLNLFQFHVDWTTPSNSTFTGPTAISNASSFSEACGGGACVPQTGTRQLLDSLGDRLMYRFAYRNFGSYESLVVSHSVATGNGNTGVRWYEIRSPGSSPSVDQQGTFAPDSSYRWMPSIAEDEKGDIALGYSVSSGSMHPAIRYTGRLASDAAGAMESENSIIEGTGSQIKSLNRWGDYSSMAVDPTDDCTFWYTNEFLQSDGTFNWSTQIASFSFPGCTTTASPDFSLSATPGSQTVTAGNPTSYTISVTPSNGYSGNVTLSVISGLPSGAGASFTPSNTISGGSGSATMNVTTSGSTSPGNYTLTVQGTDGTLTHTTSVTLVVNPGGGSGDFTISAAPSSQSLAPKNSTTYSVTVAASGGFSGTVSLSVSGLPRSTSGSFNPSSIAGSGNSTLTIKAGGRPPAGSYTLTITGTSGGLSHSTTVTLTIT
ncbi:MAG TPA: hypothetical protein VGS20_12210 [Candidatus Acidoferrales bacterium]|nr:hypothetical protein [Candidatus Acidoferrales bacterium]